MACRAATRRCLLLGIALGIWEAWCAAQRFVLQPGARKAQDRRGSSYARQAPARANGPLTGPHPAATTSTGTGKAAGFLAASFATAAVAAAARSARAAVKVEPPAEVQPRGERKKGLQNLPLGKRLQRLFSIHNRQFWDYNVFPRTYFLREWMAKDFSYAFVFATVHAGALLAPFYFTWKAFACFVVGYIITGMFGITLSYHRQLAHRSFRSFKLVEYFFAYCGALALQSHPINWVSSHRHHHGATDTENDVHSPKDGFWWAHAGWLLDQKGTWMRCNKSNASDLSAQWFYRFLQKTYPIHAIVLPIVALYAFGGLPCVLWGFFLRVVWVWHITWAVNSVSHVWGFQDWNTGDISMNNWVVGILAFGEGWHNNHHAFENSCRHGLKWWQVDMTWYTIKVLEFLGLAWELKYPTESKMRKLSWASPEPDTGSVALA